MDTHKIYSIEDLKQWNYSGTALAVIGKPINHSLSPFMHNAALAQLRVNKAQFEDWAYFRFEIDPSVLAEALELFHSKNFLGLNLTVPHKVIAMDSLKEVSQTAQSMGAVNTLKWAQAGYEGSNTDGFGLEMGIREGLDQKLKDNNILISGAGGAARAAIVQCLNQGCRSVVVLNRSSERLDQMILDLAGIEGHEKITAFSSEAALPELPAEGIYINATSLGLNPDDSLPIDLEKLPASWMLFDMVYNPLVTKLIKTGRSQGRRAVAGLGMLVHQGAKALEKWTGATLDYEVMNAAALAVLKNKPSPRNL
tara:strand:+ start:250 stop:1179 length:930 start_codon:yes stop_codon:yes gene_type:complete